MACLVLSQTVSAKLKNVTFSGGHLYTDAFNLRALLLVSYLFCLLKIPLSLASTDMHTYITALGSLTSDCCG